MAVKKIKYSKNLYTALDFLALNAFSNKVPSTDHKAFDTIKIKSYLPFKCGSVNYLIDTAYVEEILPKRDMIEKNYFPNWIKGLIAYNNSIIPVININQIMHFQVESDSNCFIVINAGGDYFALDADFVRFPIKTNAKNINADVLLNKMEIENKEYFYLNALEISALIQEFALD